MGLRVEHAHICRPAHHQLTRAGLQSPQAGAQHARWRTGQYGQGAVQAHATFHAPLERQAQKQLHTGSAGFAFGKRQGFGIFIHGRVVGHQRVNAAVGQTFAQSITVGLLAQRRVQAHTAVKVTHIGIGQVQ